LHIFGDVVAVHCAAEAALWAQAELIDRYELGGLVDAFGE